MHAFQVVIMTTILAAALLSPAARADAPMPVPEDQLAAILAAAPPCPADLDLGLELRLIDFIDCTDPADPHDFRDQGTSRVVTGPAGRYRVTAAHRHAFFSYAFRTAGRDKPVLIVVEYPDDADRVIGFTTHDSMRPARAHVSFTQETGVLTGGAMPTSNQMRYFTLINWPQDDWTPLIVLDYDRAGGAGAASRIWVYAIDAFEPLAVDAPDAANQRTVDAFFCLAFLAKRDNFGWQSRQSIEHMVDYCRAVGINRVTMQVYANQGWGAMCAVPAWDIPDDNGYLDDILTQMDRKGGVGFIAGIVADGMYGQVMAGGERIRDLPTDKAREVLLKGFDQLIDRYGKYESFQGFALGSMETIGFYDTLAHHGLVEEVVAHIKRRRPDFTVLTYVGNQYLQTPYFSGRRGSTTTTWDVIHRFETGRRPWADHVADEVLGVLRERNHDPAEMRKVDGLHVYEMTHPNDHRLHDLYTQEPRQGIYYDVLHSRALAEAFDTPYGAIFDTFTEGHIGLHADLNFWYSKNWTAPDFNFPGSLGVMPYALLQARRDRLAVSAGAWTCKYFGYETHMRRWARAFRSLPPVEMAAVPVEAARRGPSAPGDVVSAYWVMYEGNRHIAVQSRIPFACTVEIDGAARSLGPYELVALADAGSGAPTVRVVEAADYTAWVKGRIEDYTRLHSQVAAANRAAAPPVYRQAATEASRRLAAGQVYAADMALGYGLAEELRLRGEILSPPELSAPRLPAAPPMNGNLNAWPTAASDVTSDDSNIMGHTYFPNSWTGPRDHSIRLRLGHDGTNLYVGVAVMDDTLVRGDLLALWLSKAGYRDWRGDAPSTRPDMTWSITVPIDEAQTQGRGPGGFVYTCRRTRDGYVMEGTAPLAELGVRPGESIGFLVVTSDEDNEPNKSGHSWARKLTMMVPYLPNYVTWSDVRNCGRLVLGR